MKLPVTLTIRELRELKPVWLGCLRVPELRVDCAAVEAIDTAGLQMLLALQSARKIAGGMTVFEQPSSALREAARTLGLEPALGLSAEQWL